MTGLPQGSHKMYSSLCMLPGLGDKEDVLGAEPACCLNILLLATSGGLYLHVSSERLYQLHSPAPLVKLPWVEAGALALGYQNFLLYLL